MLFLILQAPIVALVIGLVFNIDENLALRAATESQIVFMLSLSVIWFGCINSVSLQNPDFALFAQSIGVEYVQIQNDNETQGR